MSRATRLLDLLQLLRRHRYPVAGAELARELEISLRTLYRDIAALQAQGAHIEGEPGVGYVLRPGYMLPPLMLSPEELETLVLGARWVSDRGDARLGAAAQNALTKIVAVLPKDLADELDSTGLMVVPSWSRPAVRVDLGDVRASIRAECRVQTRYVDVKEQVSDRTVWPLAVSFFEQVRIVIVWCELRQAFRHLRADRILSWSPLPGRYPKRRAALMKAWKAERDEEHARYEAEYRATVHSPVSVQPGQGA